MNYLSIILYIIVGIVVLRVLMKVIYQKRITLTMRFILAVNATTALHTFKTCIDINGYRYNLVAKKFAKYLLDGGWGINDKESALDMIQWLFAEGHNKKFMEDLQWFKENIDFVVDEHTKEEWEILKTAQEKYPSQGILAWDLCRVIYIAGGAYLSGYLTYKEAIKYCVQACKKLQINYTSWDDMMASYLLGYGVWTGSGLEVDESRLKKYEKLKSKGLYNIPWYTPLDENDVIGQRII